MFEYFVPFRKLKRELKGLDCELRYEHGPTLSPELLDWAFQLTKDNMQTLYEECEGWGWNDKKKRRELADSASRFVIALNQASQQPAGFVCFRFIEDCEVARLYM